MDCPWGSIIRGQRVFWVTIIPFSVEKLSLGRPWIFHSRTWVGLAMNKQKLKLGSRGTPRLWIWQKKKKKKEKSTIFLDENKFPNFVFEEVKIKKNICEFTKFKLNGDLGRVMVKCTDNWSWVKILTEVVGNHFVLIPFGKSMNPSLLHTQELWFPLPQKTE